MSRLRDIDFMDSFIKTKDYNLYMKNIIYYFYNNLVLPNKALLGHNK
jgi:hypothetical protein